MNALPTPLLRVLLLPLLLGLLSGCAVYDRIFHPHRLPTPPLSATAKAKARAAEKARHKGTTLKAAEAAPDAAGTTATDPAAASDEKKKPMSYSDLPEGTKLKYDKQGLVKKSTVDRLEANRRKLHHYDTRPLTPREASRENRRLRKHGSKNHGKASGKEAKDPDQPRRKDLPAEPLPDPTQPAEPTPAPAPKPAKVKDRKAPVPKPDPTQPAPEGSH